jgi:hypothetical protein
MISMVDSTEILNQDLSLPLVQREPPFSSVVLSYDPSGGKSDGFPRNLLS